MLQVLQRSWNFLGTRSEAMYPLRFVPKNSKLPLQLFPKGFQLVLVCVLRRPADHQPLIITRAGLRDDMEVHMIHDLMGDRPVVLQDVVVLRG